MKYNLKNRPSPPHIAYDIVTREFCQCQEFFKELEKELREKLNVKGTFDFGEEYRLIKEILGDE